MHQLTHSATARPGRPCRLERRRRLIAALALIGGCALLGPPALSADQPAPATSGQPLAPSRHDVEASSIISGDVHDSAGDQIGKVEDLLIDPSSGRLTGAVVGLTDFFGIRTRKVLIPVQDLKILGDRQIATTLDKKAILSRPPTDK